MSVVVHCSLSVNLKWKLKNDAKIDPKFWVPKSIKIEPLRAQGPPRAPRAVARVHTLGVEGPRAPRARYYKTTKQQAKGALSDTPLGQRPGGLLLLLNQESKNRRKFLIGEVVRTSR